MVARERRLQRMREEASIAQRRLEQEALLFFHANHDAHAKHEHDDREKREPKSNGDPHDLALYSKAPHTPHLDPLDRVG